jgi:hypothetical protein
MSINYRRLNPTTTGGDAIIVSYVFSSFDTKEINAMEEKLKEEVGSGIVAKDVLFTPTENKDNIAFHMKVDVKKDKTT